MHFSTRKRTALKHWFWLILPCLAGDLNSGELSFKNSNFFIKDGYISRDSYHHHDDRGFTDGSQKEIYELGLEIAKKYDLLSIVDIGCGSAYKLMKYFQEFDTVGYEIEPTLSYLNEQFPNRKWINSELSSYPDVSSVDLIICADVVEHLVNPDDLLNFIDRFDFQYLLISTPDRDLLLQVQDNNPQSQSGPPINSAHVREWNFEEFEQYVSRWFNPVLHDHSEREYWGQFIICKKK